MWVTIIPNLQKKKKKRTKQKQNKPKLTLILVCCIQHLIVCACIALPHIDKSDMTHPPLPLPPCWTDHYHDQWPAACLTGAIGGYPPPPSSPQPHSHSRIDSPAHASCRCTFGRGPLFIAVWCVRHPPAYWWADLSSIRERQWAVMGWIYQHELWTPPPTPNPLCKDMVWFFFFFFFYISSAICRHIVWVWEESLLPPTHAEFYAHGYRLTEWLRKKKEHMSFTFQLFTYEVCGSHTCPLSSTAHCTFLMEPCWFPTSSGWCNSHIGRSENVTLGLWHTCVNNADSRQSSPTDDTTRGRRISASAIALLSKMWVWYANGAQ